MNVDATTGRALEKWYGRRGLTYMLEGAQLRTSWSRRAMPPLLVMFVITMFLLVPELLVITRVESAIVSLVVLVAAWVGANLIRRRRPFDAVERIGWIESVVFVAVPTAVVGLSPASKDLDDLLGMNAVQERAFFAALMACWQLAVLAVVLIVVASGIVPLPLFIVREMRTVTSGSVGTLTAALPVLLGVVFFFFFNPGVWLVISTLDDWAYAALILLFVVLSCGFLASRAQLDLDALAHFDDMSELRESLAGTPLENDDVSLTTPVDAPLDRRHKANLRLVAGLSRLMMAFLVSLAVFCVFIVLGFLTIDSTVIIAWTKVAPHQLVGITTGSRRHMLSWEHLKVAGFLATFAGFNFSLVSASDARLRTSVKDTAASMVRQACAIRLVLFNPVSSSAPKS